MIFLRNVCRTDNCVDGGDVGVSLDIISAYQTKSRSSRNAEYHSTHRCVRPRSHVIYLPRLLFFFFLFAPPPHSLCFPPPLFPNLVSFLTFFWKRDISVCTATRLLDHRGVALRFLAGARDFYLPHSVQTGSGAQPASYLNGTRVSFHGTVREADHSPICSSEVTNAWSYTSTAHNYLWRCL
jgi:hypothetical protein